VNVGLRWDYDPGRTERFNRQVFWDKNYKEEIAPAAGWSWATARAEAGIPDLPEPIWLKEGIWGRPVMIGKDQYANMKSSLPDQSGFGPRLAAAYRFAPRMVIRGSYGLIRLTATGNTHLGNAIDNFQWGGQAVGGWPTTYDNQLHYPATYTDPFRNVDGYLPAFDKLSNEQLKTNMLRNSWWVSSTAAYGIGYEHDISLNIQREFGHGDDSWVIEAGYSGNLGRKLPAVHGLTNTPGISDQIADIDANLANVTSWNSQIGAHMNQLSANAEALADSKTNFTELLSQTEDADITDAIVQLQTRQNVYQAAIATASKILNISLANTINQ
jgi:hypothetical protein